MADLVIPNTFTAGTTIVSDDVDANFAEIATVVNDLDNDNIASSAGIAGSKLADGAITNAKVDAAAAIAGSKLDTGDGRLVQTTGLVVASGDLALTGSYQDVPGATVTFTPDVACYALVTAVFNFRSTYGARGLLTVDGVDETAYAEIGNPTAATVGHGTPSQVYKVALTVASHTLKLRALSDAGPSGTCEADATRFLYQLVAQ